MFLQTENELFGNKLFRDEFILKPAWHCLNFSEICSARRLSSLISSCAWLRRACIDSNFDGLLLSLYLDILTYFLITYLFLRKCLKSKVMIFVLWITSSLLESEKLVNRNRNWSQQNFPDFKLVQSLMAKTERFSYSFTKLWHCLSKIAYGTGRKWIWVARNIRMMHIPYGRYVSIHTVTLF